MLSPSFRPGVQLLTSQECGLRIKGTPLHILPVRSIEVQTHQGQTVSTGLSREVDGGLVKTKSVDVIPVEVKVLG